MDEKIQELARETTPIGKKTTQLEQVAEEHEGREDRKYRSIDNQQMVGQLKFEQDNKEMM